MYVQHPSLWGEPPDLAGLPRAQSWAVPLAVAGVGAVAASAIGLGIWAAGRSQPPPESPPWPIEEGAAWPQDADWIV
ncbi:hypothetical protein FHS85_001426 [Rhodoligotrophos appendicifer]|uniref:hypothetical protein n=1 Tax=Rhodoligotrophos appendicifer TaxID=987056 RepID=UPI001185C352|nr:hypothetical protein [Rhodoligotrophos appendicifer]